MAIPAWSAVAGTLLSTTLLSPSVLAEPPSEVPTHPGLLPIEFHDANGNAVVSVTRLGRSDVGPTHGECETPCRLWLSPGNYRVVLRNPESREAVGTTRLLDGPARVWVDVGSQSLRNTGLALAIVGGVATIVGFAGFVGSNTCGSDATNSDGAGGPSTMDGCASTATHVAWAAVLFGGLATGVAGLVMRSGATPSVTVVPFGAATATARTPSAKTSFPSGLGLRFTF